MRWRLPPAAPAQRAATVLLLVVMVPAVVVFFIPALRRAVPEGVLLLAIQASLLPSMLLGNTLAEWPPRPTPVYLIGTAVLAADVIALALVLLGHLAAVPWLLGVASSFAVAACLVARSVSRRATPDTERR